MKNFQAAFFSLRIIMLSGALAIVAPPHISAQTSKSTDKGVEATQQRLKRLSRFGRTKEELDALWGQPKGKTTVGGLSVSKGLKKEDEKYRPSGSWSGYTYAVDDLKLNVGFHDGKSIAISFSHTKGSLAFDEAEGIAKILTKLNFSSRPHTTDGYFCMYSNDLKSTYVFQKSGGYAVIDIQTIREQASKSKTNKTSKKL